MIIKKLRHFKIGEGQVGEYINRHDNIWPELVKEHKENGVISVTSFLDGFDLYVYFELDEEITNKLTMDMLPVRKKWQESMKEVFDPSFAPVDLKEVFNME